MRIAYLLLVHKNPEQVARLLRAVYVPGNVYGIHVDRKAPEAVHRAVEKMCAEYPNVFQLPSTLLNWGGWSIVAAELRCMKALLATSSAWDHLVCLSGQDFPLVSQFKLREILDRDPGANFVTGSPVDQWPEVKLRRLDFIFLELPGRVQRIPVRRRRPADIDIYGGDQWFIITREFAEFCVTDPLSKRIQRYMRFCHVPDEMYFATVIMNSRFKGTCANRSLRKISWHLATTSSPGIITMNDLPWLLDEEACFARKFDAEVDDEILKTLEAAIRAQGR